MSSKLLTDVDPEIIADLQARLRKLEAGAPSSDPLALIRKKALAELLDVSPATIDNWRRDPELNFPAPVIGSGQFVAWKRIDVAEWQVRRQLQPVERRTPLAGKPGPARGEVKRLRAKREGAQ